MNRSVKKLYIFTLTSNKLHLISSYDIDARYLIESLDIEAYKKGMIKAVYLQNNQQYSSTYLQKTLAGKQ